ncbi:hypothetical protein cyc_03982 [Cyclospora cayetanensis]|uniref:Uncharacterized protein n=1 Tax=Cyclospora cayetanensis TaxID=88456 RepID=A0A1D3D4G2_9EIME|nr:hypothetical protein cyc_03982 [Cyclospora cayetanensis]
MQRTGGKNAQPVAPASACVAIPMGNCCMFPWGFGISEKLQEQTVERACGSRRGQQQPKQQQQLLLQRMQSILSN